MKKLITLITFIIFSFMCFAQDPVSTGISHKKEKPNYKYDELLKQYVKVGYPETICPTNPAFDGMVTEPITIEPGSTPEGDLPYKIRYTNDGQKLVVAYNFSDNVYIYDANTKEILEIIDVGSGPEDLFLTDDHAYVCCIWSSEIYKINLHTHAIEDILSVASYPAEIKVNTDESIIYIGMVKSVHTDGGYISGLGHLSAYDLNTHEEIFTNHDIYFDVLNFKISPLGRRIYTYSDFFLINNDQEIAGKLNNTWKLCFIDALTGLTVDSVGIHPCSIVIKPGSDSLYLADVADSNTGMNFYIIDIQTHQPIDSIKENTNIEPVAYHYEEGLQVDNTGEKLFKEMDGMMFTQAGYMADFGDHNITEYSSTNVWSYTRMFSDISYDGRYVIMPNEWFAIFDFQAEEYVYENDIGTHIASKCMAASPVAYEFAWHDHVQSTYYPQYMHDEYIEFVDFSTPQEPFVSNSFICGQEPEADYMYSATFNPVHNKIITANSISNGISIIDAETYIVDTIISNGRFRLIENISDDLVAMGGPGSDTIYIFDLTSLSVVCKIYIPVEIKLQHISSVPGNECFITFHASFGNPFSIRKYLIDGANTHIVDSLETGFTFMGNSFDKTYFPEVTPDDKYLMYLNYSTFTLLHIDNMEIECSIIILDKLHGMACTEDSKRVGLVHGPSAALLSIVYLDGQNSYLERQVNTFEGGYAVEYNIKDQKFYMTREFSYDIITIDPESGVVEDTLDMNSPDLQFDIGFDPDGQPIVTTFRHLLYNDQIYSIREISKSFLIDTIRKKCIFVTPGPDKVYCLDFETTDLIEIPTFKPSFEVEVYPNPADDQITIRSSISMTGVKLTDTNGKTVHNQKAYGKQVLLNTSDLKSGIYIAQIFAGDHVESKKIIIRH